MNHRILFKSMLATASVTAMAVFSPAMADEEENTAETPAAEVSAPAKTDKLFYPLIRCIRAEGSVQVLKPRTGEWVKVVEGRYYPTGSSFRVAPTEAGAPLADFAFGEKSHIVVTQSAEFATREAAPGEQARVIDLRAGRIAINLPPTMREGMVKVVAPAFCCENLAGESAFEYSKEADGDEAVVRCVTGRFKLTGNHYVFPEMLAANQVRIRTTGDMLFTSIRGESGVCKALLDQGVVSQKDFETGETKDVAKSLEFSLSPQCSIKIFRAKSAVGGRVSVSAMTFDPSGNMLNRYAFAEGRSNINSGELVIREKDIDVEKAKAAADEEDDAETVEAAPAATEEKAEEKSEDDE